MKFLFSLIVVFCSVTQFVLASAAVDRLSKDMQLFDCEHGVSFVVLRNEQQSFSIIDDGTFSRMKVTEAINGFKIEGPEQLIGYFQLASEDMWQLRLMTPQESQSISCYALDDLTKIVAKVAFERAYKEARAALTEQSEISDDLLNTDTLIEETQFSVLTQDEKIRVLQAQVDFLKLTAKTFDGFNMSDVKEYLERIKSTKDPIVRGSYMNSNYIFRVNQPEDVKECIITLRQNPSKLSDYCDRRIIRWWLAGN